MKLNKRLMLLTFIFLIICIFDKHIMAECSYPALLSYRDSIKKIQVNLAAIIEMLNCEKSEIRCEAAWLLSRSGDKRAISPLLNILTNNKIREDQLIVMMSFRNFKSEMEKNIELKNNITELIIPVLKRYLNNDDNEFQLYSALSLYRFGYKDISFPVLDKLAQKGYVYAIQNFYTQDLDPEKGIIINKIYDPEAKPILIKATQYTNDYVRAAAAYGLANLNEIVLAKKIASMILLDPISSNNAKDSALATLGLIGGLECSMIIKDAINKNLLTSYLINHAKEVLNKIENER